MAWRNLFLQSRLGTRAVSLSSWSSGTSATTTGQTASRWRVAFQQLRENKNIYKKNPDSKVQLQNAPGPNLGPGPRSRPSPGRLVRPLLFTIGFTGCSFGTAAILQYEHVRSMIQNYSTVSFVGSQKPQKRSDFRNQVNLLWNSLSPGQRSVAGIIALNVAVFCCWRVPLLHRFLFKYFTSDPASKTLCLPMLLSTFSHHSFLHLSVNMFALWSFSSPIVGMLGPEQFMAFYLSSGVFSSFISYVGKMATGRFGPSLGASGAIIAVFAAFGTRVPDSKVGIIFLPMFQFTAGTAVKALVAIDAAGLALGWRLLDHAAHLGGAAFGIWYVLMGSELIWKNREHYVKLWHQIRRGGGSG